MPKINYVFLESKAIKAENFIIISATFWDTLLTVKNLGKINCFSHAVSQLLSYHLKITQFLPVQKISWKFNRNFLSYPSY